ncbi:hypothetical protein CRYUN_Cryun12cG0029200 [Craigia yunnanensis]
MDQLKDNPFLSSPDMSSRKGWDVREDSDALYLRIAMPGLSKEDVKISDGKEWEDEESGRRYSSRLDLTPSMYKVDEIKAEMKNGVLKVIVPKVNEEERNDVIQIFVEEFLRCFLLVKAMEVRTRIFQLLSRLDISYKLGEPLQRNGSFLCSKSRLGGVFGAGVGVFES